MAGVGPIMEANGDTLRNLADLIRANSNPDPRIRQPAELKLKEVERVVGFQSCLLTIALNTEAEPDLRLLAAIVMKNSCERLWTRTIGAGAAGVKEEKQIIKKRLVEWFNEPNKLLSTHLGIIVSEMAKCEWPNNWPDLLDTLMTVIHSDNPLVVNRGLYTLHHVLRALSQRRISTFRQTFEKAALALVRFVSAKWMEHMRSLMTLINTASRETPSAAQWKLMLDTASIALLNMKCLHRLIVYGIPNPSANQDAAEIFPAFASCIPQLLPLRRALPEDNPLHIKLSKLVRTMTRTILDCQKASPINFRAFTSPFLKFFNQLVCEQSFDDKNILTFEKLTVDALAFITSAVDTHLAKDKNKLSFTVSAGLRVDESGFNALKAEVSGVFTPQFVFGLATALITRFFSLRQSDMELWNEDPERYVADESLVTLSLSVARPHAEHLFRQLLKAFKEGLAPQLFDMVTATLSTPSPTSLGPSLLQRDAVYTAMGLDITSIKPVFMERKFDLPRVYHEVWSKELNPEGAPELKILRRRIVWLLGEWASELPQEQFPSLFAQMTRALAEPDLVVRMTAAQTIMNIIHTDTFHRVQPQFVAVMSPVINGLFQLIAHTKELDSRHKVMAAIQLIVETVGPDVRAVVPTLCDALPKLWTVCGAQQNVLRIQILATLTGLVSSLAHDSARLHTDVLVPILRYVTDSTVDDRLYLQAEGLELLQTVLQNAPAYTPELSSLFNNWVVLCTASEENMDMTLPILDSYLILGQGTFLQQHAKSVMDVMNSYTRRLKTTEVSEVNNVMPKVTAVLETIAQLFPKEFIGMFRPFMEFMLKELVQAQRKLAILAEENKRITENNKAQRRNDGPKSDPTIPGNDVLNGYLQVIARLLYQSPDGIIGLLGELTRPVPPFELLAAIVDVWLVPEVFDAIAQPYKRKLAALAMITLIPTTHAVLLQRVAGIVTCCTSVMADFETKGLKHLEYEPTTAPEGQAIEIHRVSQLTLTDPSTAAYVSREVVAALKKCQAMNSSEMWNNVHSSIDPSVWHEITVGVPPSAD